MADDDDDPQLRSLRAAWRSMPDEDPPERGLAELMAAARQQADVMAEARAPWWKKLAATLLRPPVLALASVLLLLGGLFVVTSSHKGVSPEPTPVEQEHAAPAAREPSTGGITTSTSDTTIAPPAEPQKQQPELSGPGAAPSPPAPRTPAHHAAAAPKAPERALEQVAPPKPAPEPAPPPPPVQPTPAAGADYDSKDDDAPAATRSPMKKLPAADVGPETETPREQLDDQLLAQCRAAATRGDCEVARRLAKRISNDDAAYYQAHVVGDATIAPCLAPSN